MKETSVEVLGPFVSPDGISILLRESNGQRVCVMGIDAAVATHISYSMDKMKAPRPLTYDLMLNILANFGASLEKAVISELKNDTYYATLYVKDRGGNVIKIDSRPSDAIALALRGNRPIFINDKLLQFSETISRFLAETERIEKMRQALSPSSDMSEEEALDFLEGLDPDKLPKA